MNLNAAPALGGPPARVPAPAFTCPRCDLDQVHKISQLLLPGLASACVDNVTGDLFRGPASVAVEVRKEMVEYLTRRSESYIAEVLLLLEAQAAGEGPITPAPPGHDSEEADTHGEIPPPDDIVADLLEDFAASKTNLLSRVSGWLMSESREDKIDDFAQEMETNGFWLSEPREALARTLLKNLDHTNTFHCGMGFESPHELAAHGTECEFRPVRCSNEGCNATFCEIQSEKHNSLCPFKILPCEQDCGQDITRREMDRHCITVCPMRLINCPFYQVGCRADAFPQCMVERHCAESLQSHLLYVLQVIHKQEATRDELKQRVQLLEKSESLNELSEALDVRSLTLAIREQEAKIKKLERGLSKVSQTIA